MIKFILEFNHQSSFKTCLWYKAFLWPMPNPNPMPKFLVFFINGETLMLLSVGGLIGKTTAPILVNPPLRCACHLTRGFIISFVTLASSAHLIILFKHDSQIILLNMFLRVTINFPLFFPSNFDGAICNE